MRHENYTLTEHGFVGHLAERFADFGITGLAVSLFGADCLPDSPDRIPLELIEAAARFLSEEKKIPHLSIYGQSMGSIFAALAAEKIGALRI